MNNRFKFRVWGVDCGQYMPENQFVITQDGELRHFASGLDVPQTSFIIEQCTGLEDRNGRLIFEGDRCRVYDSKTGQPVKDTVYEVVFTESASGGCACFCFRVYHGGKIYGVRPIYANGLPNIEVVGMSLDPGYQFRDATKMVGKEEE